MTYAAILRAKMNLTDFPGKKKINPEIIDNIIERAEKARNRRRYVCKVCNIMTSTDKTCYCD